MKKLEESRVVIIVAIVAVAILFAMMFKTTEQPQLDQTISKIDSLIHEIRIIQQNAIAMENARAETTMLDRAFTRDMFNQAEQLKNQTKQPEKLSLLDSKLTNAIKKWTADRNIEVSEFVPNELELGIETNQSYDSTATKTETKPKMSKKEATRLLPIKMTVYETTIDSIRMVVKDEISATATQWDFCYQNNMFQVPEVDKKMLKFFQRIPSSRNLAIHLYSDNLRYYFENKHDIYFFNNFADTTAYIMDALFRFHQQKENAHKKIQRVAELRRILFQHPEIEMKIKGYMEWQGSDEHLQMLLDKNPDFLTYLSGIKPDIPPYTIGCTNTIYK